ncbi:MAG: hypothetical protein LQ350_000306 [Teloschistes chrysophthalmus]|nr:MAG: hypothetical protein LQ350_000306 [Niorma chrysophthalma]
MLHLVFGSFRLIQSFNSFLIWQLRTSYLTHIKDGVGERLITIDSSILNDLNFRAAGWSANNVDTKRTYSPPIPTAIASDYFTAPPRSAGIPPPGFNDEDEEGGMVTGQGSTDIVGPGPNLRRKRRREQHEQEDSSDLSDESDDDADESRAAQQIKFAKMPIRHRAGSSPIQSSVVRDGVEVLVTSPSRPLGNGRLRRGSLGAVEAIKQRARRDTTTSSEMSSENELDPSVFKRRQLNPTQAAKASTLLTAKHREDERSGMRSIDEDAAEGSDASSLSSGFLNAGDTGSLLDDMNLLASSVTSGRPSVAAVQQSPKKLKPPPIALLQAPMPKRPVSTILPDSLLGQAIKAQKLRPKNPVEAFARLSGKGVPNPLNIRIYAAFSNSPDQPFEMPLQRTAQDGQSGENPQVTVADAIGLSLWRYMEEKLEPLIDPSQLNVNRWTLRMVEDGEVDYDFPPLTRIRPISDFTSNNNRGPRGRSREKPYDEFALVKASEEEFKEHQKLTPIYDQQFAATVAQEQVSSPSSTSKPSAGEEKDTPNVSPELPAAVRKLTAAPADRPILATQHSTPRIGPPKMLRIHFRSLEAYSQTTSIEFTTDTYLAEVLDTVCKKWKLDKAWHHLRVTGTRTIAPVDRTVESIGSYTDLDLERRRFVNEGAVGLSGSPGSSSPNAPLFLKTDSPKRGKRTALMLHPLAQMQDMPGITGRYKKYTVFRKQPMSFTSHHQYNLILDDDYMHAIPAESARTMSNEKTRRIPYSEIVGCKQNSRHAKQFKVVVFRENAQKRYDFIAQTAVEAVEIVEETSRGMEPFRHNDLPDRSI